MADFKTAQRVRLWDGTNDFGFVVGKPFFTAISNGTVDLDLVTIDSGYGATPVAMPIAGKYEATPTVYADGDAVPLLTDQNGRLQVGASLTIGYEYVDDTAFTPATDKVAAIGAMADETLPDSVDEGDIGIPRMTLDRKLLVRIVGAVDSQRWAIDASGNGPIDIASQTLTAVKISKDANANASGNPIFVDISAQTLTAVKISKDASANSETNPIYVQVVSGIVSGNEIHDYDMQTTTKDLTTDHDYTVTGGTFLLKSVIGSASGAGRYMVQVGPLATLVTIAVQFGSGANPNVVFTFDPPIEVPAASTGTVRVVRRNDDNSNMDMYSTIIGNQL